MEIEYKLSGLDQEHYKDDIEHLMGILQSELEKYYSTLNLYPNKIIFDSTVINQATKIKIEGLESDKPYPEISIEISRAGSAFNAPSKRKWKIITFFRASTDMINEIYNYDGTTSMLFTDVKETLPLKSKIEEVIDKSNKYFIEVNTKIEAISLFIF